jgi:molecular chaperone GrpE
MKTETNSLDDGSEADASELRAENDVAEEEVPQVDPSESAEPAPDKQINDLKDQLLRALADVENTRRRAQREKEDTAKYAIASFARDILGVADNLSRALDAVPEETRASGEEMQTLFQGVELTKRELQTTMERHGISQISPLGEKFDHNFHQAMYEVESADAEPGTVIQVAQLGYVIGERLLRPAMVGVSKKPSDQDSNADEPKMPSEPASGTTVNTKA